jgi:hypothetical protein
LALDPGYPGLVLKFFGLIRYPLRPDQARLQFEKTVCGSERDPTPRFRIAVRDDVAEQHAKTPDRQA